MFKVQKKKCLALNVSRGSAPLALASLESINLSLNQIGDAGVTSLASACAKGALPLLKELFLSRNQIGDAGVSALAGACASGALAQLQVSSHPTALSPCLETWHANSPDSDLLYGVQYAETLARQQPDWRCRARGALRSPRHGGTGAVAGKLAPHCLIPKP